jgi:hypothetical protein
MRKAGEVHNVKTDARNLLYDATISPRAHLKFPPNSSGTALLRLCIITDLRL